MSKKKNIKQKEATGSSYLRKPAVQIGLLALAGIIIFFLMSASGSKGVARSVSVEQAHQMVQDGDFLLDVRTQQEWDEYHATNATLIPLDQLPGRLSEVPKDKPVVVICRSGNRSQNGRDILLSAGYEATSVDGGMKAWYANGYEVEGTPPAQ